MAGGHKSRDGSLQVWPRKRAARILPSANWDAVKTGKNLAGFIGYKVGMCSVYVKDNTADSMTKGKKIVVPATILECPALKIYSVRFYKNKKVIRDFFVGFEDELKSKIKKPKQLHKLEEVKDFDDVRVVVYSSVKDTALKEVPDVLEIALTGTKEQKINFIKEKIGKPIGVSEVFSDGLVDIRAVSKGKGLQGPVTRFGISLKSHKAEKGQRRPGNLAPWHPARVTFRTAMAGQWGFFTRVCYNNLILQVGKISEKDINRPEGFYNYGKIRSDYIVLKGSLPGPSKRPVLLTHAIRPTRYQFKKKLEVVELR